MNVKDNKTKNIIVICLIIGLSFFWTGSGYITWMYHMMNYHPLAKIDMYSEVTGYLFQCLGLIIFTMVVKKNKTIITKNQPFIITSFIDLFMIACAVMVPDGSLSLMFGYIMNVFHGLVAGFYLTRLVTYVSQQNRGVAFGLGYGLGSIGSYVISIFDNGNFIMSRYSLLVYLAAVLITSALICVKRFDTDAVIENEDNEHMKKTDMSFALDYKILLLAGLTVFMLSMAKNSGFYFSTIDMADGISLELTRTFYALGLIIAGIVNDKNRKLGAVLCVSTLAFPFALLVLKSSLESSIVVWILSYGFFGFFSVYRVVLFADFAGKKENLIWIAGMGLMAGRLGDAAGAYAGMKLMDNISVLVLLAALVFMFTIFLFVLLFQKIYTPIIVSAEERKGIEDFCRSFLFSPREHDVFKLIDEGLSNTEIADRLFISENTVKFHIKNILRKTESKNRIELLNNYERYKA